MTGPESKKRIPFAVVNGREIKRTESLSFKVAQFLVSNTSAVPYFLDENGSPITDFEKTSSLVYEPQEQIGIVVPNFFSSGDKTTSFTMVGRLSFKDDTDYDGENPPDWTLSVFGDAEEMFLMTSLSKKISSRFKKSIALVVESKQRKAFHVIDEEASRSEHADDSDFEDDSDKGDTNTLSQQIVIPAISSGKEPLTDLAESSLAQTSLDTGVSTQNLKPSPDGIDDYLQKVKDAVEVSRGDGRDVIPERPKHVERRELLETAMSEFNRRVGVAELMRTVQADYLPDWDLYDMALDVPKDEGYEQQKGVVGFGTYLRKKTDPDFTHIIFAGFAIRNAENFLYTQYDGMETNFRFGLSFASSPRGSYFTSDHVTALGYLMFGHDQNLRVLPSGHSFLSVDKTYGSVLKIPRTVDDKSDDTLSRYEISLKELDAYLKGDDAVSQARETLEKGLKQFFYLFPDGNPKFTADQRFAYLDEMVSVYNIHQFHRHTRDFSDIIRRMVKRELGEEFMKRLGTSVSKEVASHDASLRYDIAIRERQGFQGLGIMSGPQGPLPRHLQTFSEQGVVFPPHEGEIGS